MGCAHGHCCWGSLPATSRVTSAKARRWQLLHISDASRLRGLKGNTADRRQSLAVKSDVAQLELRWLIDRNVPRRCAIKNLSNAPCRTGPQLHIVKRVGHAPTFRGLFLKKLTEAHDANHLKFFGNHTNLADRTAFAAFLAPLRKVEWVVYAKEPFAGPEPVLRYLARYTHRVAISNRRLVAADEGGRAFRWKDYRLDGPDRWKTMTLHPHEFIRRFLMHVLPKGFHRIRHYGLFANGNRASNIARLRQLLSVPAVVEEVVEDATCDDQRQLPCPCPRCGGRMIIIEVFAAGMQPTSWPVPTQIRIDTS